MKKNSIVIPTRSIALDNRIAVKILRSNPRAMRIVQDFKMEFEYAARRIEAKDCLDIQARPNTTGMSLPSVKPGILIPTCMLLTSILELRKIRQLYQPQLKGWPIPKFVPAPAFRPARQGKYHYKEGEI